MNALLFWLGLAALSAALSADLCAGARAEGGRQCYSTGETRERIAADGLSDPFRAMQKASSRMQAEALAAKLCRGGDEFIYEVSLLRRDGKILRSFIDARSGQIIDKKSGE